MSSPPKKRRTRSKSTSPSRRPRAKTARKPAQTGSTEAEVSKPSDAQEQPAVTAEQSAPSEWRSGDPVPQPIMNTPFLPDEAPNIVTGYVRLITLGLSFFLAVYLGLEAFSLLVQFPTRLPISSLLIADGHLSTSQAAYALIGLLFAQVAVVQVWAWRTRLAGATYEELESETTPEPVAVSVPQSQAASPVPQAQAASPSMAVPAENSAPTLAFPDDPRPVEPTPMSEPSAPVVQEPAPSAPGRPEVHVDPPVERTAVQETPRTAPPAVQAQPQTQEQESGQVTQFEAPSGETERSETESPKPSASGPKTASAASQETPPVWAPPVVAPRNAQLKEQRNTQPAVSDEAYVVKYQIYPDNPDVFVGIQRDKETGGFRYIVVEPRLTQYERDVYKRLTRLLIDELEVDMAKLKNNKMAEKYLVEEAKMLAKKYKISVVPDAYKKIAYYFTRDYLKLGKIEVLMNDPRIEDVSCDGPNIPLYIWHREYESIPTNVMFQSDEELNTFASKLAYISGKHISIASPIVDATLPDGSRIQITYGKEVTKKGSTFTIRKFKGDPITIVDLLKYNTLSPELGAYLWYLIEKRMSLLVAGGTASGKTTTLNALSMFIPPDQKIVSVEDTPELNLSHKNWIQSVTRGGGVAGEITLFDLLKAAMRQRPDIIVVGEVRGVEAFTLFQAIATGHGGLGTVHADSVEAAINRLTTEPMNVPKSLLGSTLDCLIMQLRIKMRDKSVRRMVHVAEIVGHESSSDQIVLNNVFKWDPVSDKYVFGGRSRLFDKITKRYGTSPEKIRSDIEDRRIYLNWLSKQNVRDYRDLSQRIRDFYADPNMAVERALRDLGEEPA
jgi:flagellar protein FlaI